ncbi:MAG: glutamyl-tRNA reductase [Euryarchaeota archaeon]|nr:glutamyl-tRNA reductase [Euryarchaeota archaeon]
MNGIMSVSITHKWASLNDLECARIGDVEVTLKAMYAVQGVRACVILQTCNRIEAYLNVDSDFDVDAFVDQFFPLVPRQLIGRYESRDALKRLLRLAAGLESMIVGEDQILGQLKSAAEIARQMDTLGLELSLAFSKAIQVGKRARNETQINRGSVSVGSAAVDLAEKILGTLDDKVILTIGAGELGTLVAVALAERNLKTMFVSNRTFRRAQTLAERLNGVAVRFDRVEEFLTDADLAISATAAPHYILTHAQLTNVMQRRYGRRLLIVDIANPRDVEEAVAGINGVELHNIDDLKKITEQNLLRRRSEIGKVVAIINEELKVLEEQFKKRRADELIASLYRNAESIRTRELQKAYKRIHADGDAQRYQQVLDDLTGSIVKKLLFELTESLKEAAISDDHDLMLSAHKLFKLKGD